MKPRKKGYHRHHIIPKHQGGSDDDDNIEYLTPSEHSQAHYELWLKYGLAEDAMAYNSLKKYWDCGRDVDGYKQSPEHIEKRVSSTDYSEISKKLKGRTSPTKGMKFGANLERNKKISTTLKGKRHSDEHKKKISETLTGRPAPYRQGTCYCIFCRKRVPLSRMSRHGLNKKECISEKYIQQHSL
jgi:hypothetical protein